MLNPSRRKGAKGNRAAPRGSSVPRQISRPNVRRAATPGRAATTPPKPSGRAPPGTEPTAHQLLVAFYTLNYMERTRKEFLKAGKPWTPHRRRQHKGMGRVYTEVYVARLEKVLSRVVSAFAQTPLTVHEVQLLSLACELIFKAARQATEKGESWMPVHFDRRAEAQGEALRQAHLLLALRPKASEATRGCENRKADATERRL